MDFAAQMLSTPLVDANCTRLPGMVSPQISNHRTWLTQAGGIERQEVVGECHFDAVGANLCTKILEG